VLRVWPGVFVAACQVYDPSLVLKDGEVIDVDAGMVMPGTDAGTAACPLARPPPRPSGADDGRDIGPQTWALKEPRLRQDGEAWREIGFDRDNLCTLAGDMAEFECIPPEASAAPEVDGDNGIDNSFGHNIWPILQAASPTLEGVAVNAQEDGTGNIMIKLLGWNGERSDPRVAVHVSTSVDAAPRNGSTTPPSVVLMGADVVDAISGAVLPPPEWTDDWFWVRSDAYLMNDLDEPKVQDTNAYVSNNTLVFTLTDRTPIYFQGVEQSLVVLVTNAVVAATITNDGAELDPVVVAGRWSRLDILSTAEQLGVCPDTAQYMIIENALERSLDVRSMVGSGGPGVFCDALSIGITFHGYRATIAATIDTPNFPDPCD
jgi:hypothetical protein